MCSNQQPERWRNSLGVHNKIPTGNRLSHGTTTQSQTERKRIKIENNNNNEDWSTNGDKLITSPVTGRPCLRPKMHAVVQTSIPTVTKGVQTKTCEQYDSACQTDKELIERKVCDIDLHRKMPCKNASSQTDDRILLASSTNNTTVNKVANCYTNEGNISAPILEYLSDREDQYLATFQDLAILNYTIDNLGKQQLALIENTRNPQVKFFLQNIVFNHYYRSLQNSVEAFMKQMITAEWNVQVNLVCPKQLANNLWRKLESITQSTQVETRETFTSIIENRFGTILQEGQKTSMAYAQTQQTNIPSTGSLQGYFNYGALINNLNPSAEMNESLPSYAQGVYHRSYAQMSNNSVAPLINTHQLPFLSASDVMEEIRREESRRNEQLRNC